MKFKSKISKILISLFVLGTVTSISINTVHADAYKVVTLGANLTQKQKDDMLKYFNVNKKESNIIEVNIQEEKKYLEKVASKKQMGSRSISCSYVNPTEDGGLKVSTHNIYWVNESMIKNALITAGIENAQVKAAAPFNVSGTAALTGILKGFEQSAGGQKIPEDKKEVANEEVVTTGNIGEKIGQDKAAGMVNEIKKKVIKEKPKDKEETQKIVNKVVKDFDEKLDEDDISSLTDLMEKMKSLDFNIDKIMGQLNNVTNQLKDFITSDETQGFFHNLWEGIKNFFNNLFGGEDSSEDTSLNNTFINKNRLTVNYRNFG